MFLIAKDHTCLSIFVVGVTRVANSDKMQWAVFHKIFSGVSVLKVNAILLYFHIFADTMIISQRKFKEVINHLSDRIQKQKKKHSQNSFL